MGNVQHTHPIPRKYLELIQDVIVLGLCVMLFVAMGIKLFHLGQLMIQGADFALVVGNILFILVLVDPSVCCSSTCRSITYRWRPWWRSGL